MWLKFKLTSFIGHSFHLYSTLFQRMKKKKVCSHNLSPFSTKTEEFFCFVLAVHLPDNGVLGAWKCKLFKASFKVQV